MANDKLNDFIIDLRINYEKVREEEGCEEENLEEPYAIVYAACEAMLDIEKDDADWREFVIEALHEVIYQKDKFNV